MILQYHRRTATSIKAAAVGLVLCLCLSADVTAGVSAAGGCSRTLRSMARVYMAFGQYDKAQVFAAEALDQAQGDGTDEAELAMCLIDLGTVYQYQGKLGEAEEMLTAGISLQKRAPEENPYIGYTLRMLSSVCRRQQRYAEAQAILDEATAIMLEEYASDGGSMAFFQAEQAKLLADQGQLEQARDIYRQALATIESTYGEDHLSTADVYLEVASLDLELARLEEARTHIDRAIRIRMKYYGERNPLNIQAWFVKARICRAEGNFADSERIIEKALATTTGIKDPVKLAELHRQASEIRRDVQLAKL